MEVNPAIESILGVCGGAARIARTRIPVWQLVKARQMGASDTQLLIDYPILNADDLRDAWSYAANHPDEITAELRRNDENDDTLIDPLDDQHRESNASFRPLVELPKASPSRPFPAQSES
jgi:uncharacterized protein (DUF433 family)